MRFIDEVNIQIESGKGGDGCVGFRREKFVAKGGPDGGHGGDGGSIYFMADSGLNTLIHFRGKKNYTASEGSDGEGGQRAGRTGEDLILKVPIGTIVRNKETGEVLCDLKKQDEKFLIAEGGRGGLGNSYFKTATNQTPRFAMEGKEGQVLDLHLELKLIADIALIGLPNAGKSTLIAALSSAKPKIADYPFTTLEPNLGVVKGSDDTESLVVADIPGLIEDAAAGKGLGIQFLKHIERTSALIHLIDISWCLEEFEAFESYTTIRTELEKYDSKLLNRPEIICLTKIDAMTSEEVERFKKFFETTLDKKVLPISSVSGESLKQLKRLMFKTKEKISE